MRDAQPRLQGLVSTVLVDSPHSDHSLAVHTVTALAKHARFLYPQLDALLRAVCARSQRVLLVLHVSHTKEEEMAV